MDYAQLIVSASGGAVIALAPLVYLMYVNKPVTYVVWTGALNAFIAGFILTLLAQQWGLFYARFTYLLALGLLSMSVAYTYVGMARRRWTDYIVASAAWLYLILLAVVARALGTGDPFIA